MRRQDYRDSIHRVDPDGCEERKRNRLVRRVYHCAGPNHVHHLDSHHKSNNFGLVIHGDLLR